MAQATLAKGFEHDGKIYRIGDKFEGSEAEIADLTRQGYIVAKKEDPAPEEPAQPSHAGKGRY